MSATIPTTFEVFLAHAASDKGVAEIVERAFTENGLDVFSVDDVKSNQQFLTDFRFALAECSAFVLILTRSTIDSQDTAFEIGAAMGWNKPIFILYDGVTLREIPRYLKEFRVVPLSKLSQIVREITKLREPFTDSQRQSLVDAYEETGVPTDQLVVRPMVVRSLWENYLQRSNSYVAPERLVEELIRLRKQGRLPTLGRKNA